MRPPPATDTSSIHAIERIPGPRGTVGATQPAGSVRRVAALLLLTLLWTALAAVPAGAQFATGDDSVLVRVGGDATVAAGDDLGVVVVVDGDLRFAAAADTVVVVGGTADLQAATVDTLVVVSGEATLGADTVVRGDVYLADAAITQDPTAAVQGSIRENVGAEFARGFWIVGVLLMIGWAILTLLAGLAVAAVAPDLARRAGRTLTTEIGPTVLAGLVVWIVLPIVGGLLFAAIIGVPTALAIWLVVLPALGVGGFLISGIRLGEQMLATTQRRGHPYLASFVGLLTLIVAGVVPFIGPMVVAVAGFLGSGALALLAVRAAIRPRVTTERAEPPRLPSDVGA